MTIFSPGCRRCRERQQWFLDGMALVAIDYEQRRGKRAKHESEPCGPAHSHAIRSRQNVFVMAVYS